MYIFWMTVVLELVNTNLTHIVDIVHFILLEQAWAPQAVCREEHSVAVRPRVGEVAPLLELVGHPREGLVGDQHAYQLPLAGSFLALEREDSVTWT